MPATAGRVRMPHGNRVSSSDSLRTNDMWTKTIGGGTGSGGGGGSDAGGGSSSSSSSSSDHAAGLMLLARMTNVSGSETRGGCTKCGELRLPVPSGAIVPSPSLFSLIALPCTRYR